MSAQITTSLLCCLFCFGQVFAENDKRLIQEMSKYLDSMLKDNQAAAKGKSKRELMNQAGRVGVFHVNEKQKNALDTSKPIFTDVEYEKALVNLESLNSKDPELKYVQVFAKKPDLSYFQKTLAYRLAVTSVGVRVKPILEKRKANGLMMAKAFQEYVKKHNKPPASIKELRLDTKVSTFVNLAGEKMDWCYIGNLTAKINVNGTKVMAVEPEALVGLRLCVLENGQIAMLKNESIEENIKKLGFGAKEDGEKKTNDDVKVIPDEYFDTKKNMESIMKKYVDYKRSNDGKAPSSLAKLKLTRDEKKFHVKEERKWLNWIYLGSKSHIKNQDGKLAVLFCPRAIGDKRMVGFDDGKVALIDEEKIKDALKKKK